MSFITFVEPSPPQNPAPDQETMGILIERTPDGTRGNAFLMNPNGTTRIVTNVPIDGNQVSGGAYLKMEPPANLAPEEQESGYSS